MEQKSMTALISAFARWYHAEHNEIKIFDDSLAGKILTDDEKQQISFNMSSGIEFFNPAFKGTSSQALRWIVDNQLSPTPLSRAAWAERALRTAVKTGAEQYLIVAAGYDTFAYRQPAWATGLQIFELDLPAMMKDKQKRVQAAFEKSPENLTCVPINLANESLSEKLNACNIYDKSKLTFCSLLGITYYLTKESFKALLCAIAGSVPEGSTIVFDHPDEYAYTERAGDRAKKQTVLASGAKEEMLASYSCKELSRLLSDCGFLIYEYLAPEDITKQYFSEYNEANPAHQITAFDHVNYCLAVAGNS